MPMLRILSKNLEHPPKFFFGGVGDCDEGLAWDAAMFNRIVAMFWVWFQA